MTKKVLIIGLNYSGALSGRINIAVNARGVFIADYGILEENITYLTDEWAPLTKAQITTAIQTLVSESALLDELYVYYAGYGSGIRIVKTVDYGEVPLSLDSVPLSLESVPVGSVPVGSVPVGSVPVGSVPLEPLSLDSVPLEPLPDDTITISIDELSNVELSNVELSNTELSNVETVLPVTEPDVLIPMEPPTPTPTPTGPEVLPTGPEVLPTGPEVLPTGPEEPLTYKYEFYPPIQSYDKLAKQMVGSDYEIIDTTEILSLLSNSRCRTICVLDMCDYKGIAAPLMWGTDIIGNVNIISFAESDVVSSGKLETIQVITNHISAA
jgi:hypothetical protein